MSNEKISDNIMSIAKCMMQLQETMYNQWKPIVGWIIEKKMTDKKTIEQCLDMVMDILTDKGYALFIELCNYYATIDEEAANEYLNIYNELYGEEAKVKKKSCNKLTTTLLK